MSKFIGSVISDKIFEILANQNNFGFGSHLWITIGMKITNFYEVHPSLGCQPSGFRGD
jgi:hypothetical protein